MAVYPKSDHRECFVHKVRSSLRNIKRKYRKKVAIGLRKTYLSAAKQQAVEMFEEFK